MMIYKPEMLLCRIILKTSPCLGDNVLPKTMLQNEGNNVLLAYNLIAESSSNNNF